ncbi:MAG: LysM peptidoglycan-binding domain-containing protein [Saprospiraceae bacterium]
MKRLLFGIFLLGLFNTTFAQEAIYLKYQPNSCVKQYFYKAATNSGNGMVTELFDYHIEWNSQEKTVIRSFLHGEYDKNSYKLANQIKSCNEMRIFKSLKPDTKQEIYIVEETTDKYLVYKADRISVETNSGTVYKTTNEEYLIDYNKNEPYGPSQKLGVHPTTGTSILFGGKEKNGCHEQFGMVAMPAHACSTQVSLEYVEDIGLYIEKNGDGFFMLKTIDKKPIKDYLKSECAAKQDVPSGYNQPLSKGNTAKGGQVNNSKINDKVTLVSAYNSNNPKLGNGNTAKGGSTIPKSYSQPIKKKVEVVASFNKKSPTLNGGNAPKGGFEIPKEYDQPAQKKIQIVAPFNSKKNPMLNSENTPKGGSAIPTSYNQNAKGNAPKIVVEFPYDNKNIPTKYEVKTQRGARFIKGKAVKYTVRSKDTLYSLSKKYDTTIQELMKWNGLASPTIYTDQELVVGKVPAPL